MTIKVGEKIPDVSLRTMVEGKPTPITTTELTAGKKVALFGVPGAFTPTCSAKHLPGYKEKAAEFRAKGFDTIACVSVNDAFVMGAWGREHKADDKVVMLGDGSCELTEALGLTVDRREAGMGIRSQRYSMIVDNGVVTALNIEPSGEYGVSSAEAMLEKL